MIFDSYPLLWLCTDLEYRGPIHLDRKISVLDITIYPLPLRNGQQRCVLVEYCQKIGHQGEHLHFGPPKSTLTVDLIPVRPFNWHGRTADTLNSCDEAYMISGALSILGRSAIISEDSRSTDRNYDPSNVTLSRVDREDVCCLWTEPYNPGFCWGSWGDMHHPWYCVALYDYDENCPLTVHLQ